MGNFRPSRHTLRKDVTIVSSVTEKPVLTIKSTNADEEASQLKFVKDGASAADDDELGTIDFYGENDAGTPESIQYASIAAQSTDISDGAENVEVLFKGYKAGALTELARMNPESSTANTFLGGFGFKRPVVVLSSGTTYVLTGAQSGVLLVLNDAFSSNMTITLPADTAANIGFTCTIFIAKNITGTLSINAANAADVMFGGVKLIRASVGASRCFQAGSADDGLTIDADTKGRLEGSVFDITIAAANVIAVDARAVFAGTSATAFADNS